MKNKFLLLEGIHSAAVEKIKKSGFEVDLLDKALPEADLIAKLKDYNAVGIRSKTQITDNVIKNSLHLDAIGTFCIGTNQVNLSAAKVAGIPVFNAPYSNTRSVAELIISESISLFRGISEKNICAHKGVWKKSATGSHEVRGKTMGIVGYGHIGSQTSILAEAMGFNVIYFDVVKKLPLGNARPTETLKELLEKSDIVTFHVPETPQTKDMVTKKEISQMKKGSYLINASRGSVVVISDLANALESGHLAGAAIDVFPAEPGSNKEEFTSELIGFDNVILTPHVGGSTEEAQEAIGHEVSESLLKYLNSGGTGGAVNFPNVDLPNALEATRVVNVHKNVPGVLGDINSIVSEKGVNISGQYLSTDQDIGYLVMDMKAVDAANIADEIAKKNYSIKTRVL